MILNHFNELPASDPNKKIPFPKEPERIRIRSLFGIRPSTVYPNSKLLKEIISQYHYTHEVIIQILPENQIEDKLTDDHIVLILRQFYPDKYELGPVIEITAHKDDKIINIKSRIATIIGIPVEQLSITTADMHDIQTVLRLPKLNWIPRPQEDKSHKHHKYYSEPLDPNRPLRSSVTLDDGSMILCRDLSVPRKILTPSEEKKNNG